MHLVLVAAKLVTMSLGLLISYQAYRGYRRNDSTPMLHIAVGFLFISVGAIIQGLLFEFVGLDIFDAGAIQTALVAVGMLFVLYSIYGDRV